MIYADMPTKCVRVLYDPLRRRYKILYGGRGSAKSWSAARYLLMRGASEKLRILCTREIQNSIKDSVYRLLVDQIHELHLEAYYIIKADTISGTNGTEFLFKGLRQNIEEVKSTEGIDICWVEEAEKVSENSWTVLIPTIRKENSELIITFNPDGEHSATYTRFVEKDGNPVNNPQYAREFVNFWDNPWFPAVLRKEMDWDRTNDPEKYEHVWCGLPKKYGNSIIFRNVIVESFEAPEGSRFFFGSDFGYAQDPSALVRHHIRDRRLYIDFEAYGIGVELDQMHQFFELVPESHNWKITADSARPETISYLSRPYTDPSGVEHDGFNIVGAEKGKGSVEDGIAFLKSFEAIVIHPRCTGSIDNYKNYRWKTDRITGDVLPIPLDKSNHVPDASRYALEAQMKGGATIFDAMEG